MSRPSPTTTGWCTWPVSPRKRTGSRSSLTTREPPGFRIACARLSFCGYNEQTGMTMNRKRSACHLRLLFVLAVVIPCLILGVIAIRSINREKAFIELRLQRTLDAELVHMVSPGHAG